MTVAEVAALARRVFRSEGRDPRPIPSWWAETWGFTPEEIERELGVQR